VFSSSAVCHLPALFASEERVTLENAAALFRTSMLTAHAAEIRTAPTKIFPLRVRLFSFSGTAAGITRNNTMKAFLLPLCLIVSFSPVFADDVGLRLRLGIHDKEATDWSGTISVAPGKVTLISGWRFAQQDKADGVVGWSCRTHPAALDQRRSNNPKQQQKRANAPATALPMSDTGVLVSLTEVSEDSQVTVKMAQGEITFKLADVPLGKIMEQFGGGAEIERTAASIPFVAEAKTDDDFPSGAVAPDGTVWVAWQSYTPGMDRAVRAKSFDQEPTDLKSLATAPGGCTALLAVPHFSILRSRARVSAYRD